MSALAETPATADARAWRTIGMALGAGRIGLGVAFWVMPVLSVRIAGLDAPTARGADFLARMTAARDVSIGVGAVQAGVRVDSSPVERAAWALGGAVADLGDAIAIRRGVREGRLARLAATATSSGAAVVAGVSLAVAGRELLGARRR